MFQKPPQNHILNVTCKAEKNNRVQKLKILKRELKHKIRKFTSVKDFVFADPLLPFGTIREALRLLSPFGFCRCTSQHTKKPKELNFAERIKHKKK